MAIEDWNDNTRSDGLRVEKWNSNEWHIMPAHGGFLRICPCCDSPFATASTARRVADVVFPILDQAA